MSRCTDQLFLGRMQVEWSDHHSRATHILSGHESEGAAADREVGPLLGRGQAARAALDGRKLGTVDREAIEMGEHERLHQHRHEDQDNRGGRRGAHVEHRGLRGRRVDLHGLGIRGVRRVRLRARLRGGRHRCGRQMQRGPTEGLASHELVLGVPLLHQIVANKVGGGRPADGRADLLSRDSLRLETLSEASAAARLGRHGRRRWRVSSSGRRSCRRHGRGER